MINVCYIPHGKDYSIIRHVAKLLNKVDIRVLFIAKTKEDFALYKRDGFEAYYISEIINRRSAFTEKELLNIDLQYGPPLIKGICNSDKYMPYLFKDQNAREQLVARGYRFWEDFLDRHKIDYFIAGGETASFIARTAYNVARFRSIPISTIGGGPGEGYFNLYDVGEDYCWSELLGTLNEGVKPLTNNQRHLALQFVETSIKKNPARYAFSRFQDLRELLWGYRRRLKALLETDPMESATLQHYINWRLERIRWWYGISKFFRYNYPADDKYVYFPLFYEKEAMTLANQHYWSQNMLSLIRAVAESLPAGIKLYVKEHPFNLGGVSYKRLKIIKNTPNVKVIYPLINGQELIDGCVATFVLEGTSGWEAYLSRKPVVIAGSLVYYSRSNLIYKMLSTEELPNVLLRAIREGDQIYNKDEEGWLWFIHSVITTSGRGSLIPCKSSSIVDCSDENCKNIVSHISQKIRRDLASIL